MADLRKSTIIEENYPPVRRNTVSGLFTTNFNLNHSLPNFLTNMNGKDFSKSASKSAVKENEQMISQHFKKIHAIINIVDEHITRRLENHQNEVFSLVKNEIEEMREETNKIVDQLNRAIAEKNTEDQIWILSNELDYFKSQTFKLFEENKKMREQIKDFTKKTQDFQIQLENNDALMQKLKQNYMREKLRREKLIDLIQEKINKKQNPELINLEAFEIAFNKTQKKMFNAQQSGTKTYNSYQKVVQSTKAKPKKKISNQKSENNLIRQRQVSRVIITLFDEEEGKEDASIKKSKINIMNEDRSQNKYYSVSHHRHLAYPEENQKMFSSIKFANKAVQTQHIEASQQNIWQQSIHVKKIDLMKNGFYVTSFNEKNKRLKTQPESQDTQNEKNLRYMAKTFRKNKLRNQQNNSRFSGNKTLIE